MLTPEQKNSVLSHLDKARAELTLAAEIMSANRYHNEAEDMLWYAEKMAIKIYTVTQTIPASD